MPTQLTYTIGTGRDYSSIQTFSSFIQTLDLVALDQQITGLVYENQNFTWPGVNINSPITRDATHYVVCRPAPGLGVNDLETSGVGGYGTVGLEINTSNDPTANFSIGPGIIIAGFRIFAGNVLSGASGAQYNTGPWGGFSRCRIKVFNFMALTNYTGTTIVADCLIIKTTNTSSASILKPSGGTPIILRNTLIMAAGLTATDGAGISGEFGSPSVVVDNLFINCSGQPIAATLPMTSMMSPTYFRTNQIPVFFDDFKGNVSFFVNNYTDTVLNGSNSANQLACLTYGSGLVVNTTSNFLPAGTAIGTADAGAVSVNDLRGNNRGLSPDVGALQATPAMPLPGIVVTSVLITGQTTVVSGTTTSTPTAGTVSMVASGNGAVGQGPFTATLGSGTFTATFNALLPGTYTPTVSMTNAGGSSTLADTARTIIGIIGNPTIGITPATSGGSPTSSILKLFLTGRSLSASGTVDFQGDAAGTLLAYLDPQPSGTSVAVTTSINGRPTPNIVGTHWGLMTLLTGNSYKLRMVTTANGFTTTTLSNTFTVSITSGTAHFPSAVTTPTLTWSSWSSRNPGSQNTATYAFSYGAPASITATSDAVSLTVSNIVVTVAAGSGATARGTVSFTFTNPAAGSHAIIASSTGSFATTASATLVTAVPTLTWGLFTNTTPSHLGATALYNFTNGAPASVTATLNGSPLTIDNILVTVTSGTTHTAQGTVVFTYTNPVAGSYSLIVSSTGTYAVTAAAKTLLTIIPSLTWVSWSTTIAGATNTATFSFTTGAPTGVTASINGKVVALSGFNAAITSGSGSTAVGTVTFTFTNLPASNYTMVVNGQGTFASPTASTALLMITDPIVPTLVWASFTSSTAGSSNTASYNYANGKPTGAIAKLAGASLTISSVTITGTATGTVTFSFTNPIRGEYTLVAQGTGTNASVAPAVSLSIS